MTEFPFCIENMPTLVSSSTLLSGALSMSLCCIFLNLYYFLFCFIVVIYLLLLLSLINNQMHRDVTVKLLQEKSSNQDY